jgi:hypothetical protein
MNAGKPPAFLHARPFSFQRAGHDVCDLIPEKGDAGGCGEIEGDVGAPCPTASAVVDLRELSMATLYSYSPAGNLEGAFPPSGVCDEGEGACRLPILRAADLGLKRAGNRHTAHQ